MDSASHPYTLEPGEQLLWHEGNGQSQWWGILPMITGMIPTMGNLLSGRHSPWDIGFGVFAVVAILAFAWILRPGGRSMTWRKNWMYRVTNTKVVVQPGRSSKQCILLRAIGDLTVRKGKEGKGSVVIGYAKEVRELSDGTRVPGTLSYVSLEDIPNPYEVYALIEGARQALLE